MSSSGETGPTGARPHVPAPLPPDDPEAWYAPEVQSQYEIHPGVVVTVSGTTAGFRYDVREPPLTESDRQAYDRVVAYFADAQLDRPRTREGATERMAAGFGEKHRRVVDRLLDRTDASRRRLEYHLLAKLRCLGAVTPYALDDRIDVADVTDDGVVVHTDDFAPARTDLSADDDHLDRFASERLQRHTVEFLGFEIPVVVYRENLIGSDPFAVKYAVQEPDLLPGDEELIAECKSRIWETSVDGLVEDQAAFVRERARDLLTRQLTIRNTRAWLDALSYRVRAALSEWGLAVPPVDERAATDRLDDLVYYVLRDYVGFGKLTIPIRDPTLEDVEANRLGERVKVVPRPEVGHAERVPTNLTFEDEREFVNVVKQLAAADGTELNAATPSAKVNLSPPGVDETIRCAVALPTISEDGPHISIRKQSADVLTPVDLIERGSIPTELVALLWECFETHGVVLFSGPTGVGKTTLMNAHMPFLPVQDRPISIDEGSREVRLPHETGVSLSTRDHERDHKRVTMADLMTECNYLNPDVEVIAEINSAASFETFAEVLNTGHGVVGTTHAADIETLVNRLIEQGVPTYLLAELDLVVFPRHVDDDRYVGEVVELLSESQYEALNREDGRCGVVERGETAVYWNTVAYRDHDGTFRFAFDTDDLASVTGEGGDLELGGALQTGIFERLGRATDRSVAAVAESFERKRHYVEYLQREGVTDADELFETLANLTTNEAATVERMRRRERDRRRPDAIDVREGSVRGDD